MNFWRPQLVLWSLNLELCNPAVTHATTEHQGAYFESLVSG